VVIEQKAHWSPVSLNRRLRAKRASTTRLRPEALVIGEVPAWFLRDLGPKRVRTRPAPGRRGPSPVVAGPDVPCARVLSKVVGQDLPEERDLPLETVDHEPDGRGVTVPWAWAVLEVLGAQNAARISSGRRSMVRVAPTTEAEVNFC
jgi:hypothetical protein